MGIDYKTKPLSREVIREYSKFIRKDLNLKNSKFSIEEVINCVFEKYKVMFLYDEDYEFHDGVCCYLVFINDKAHIHIKNSVYENACEGDHKSIGFIIHEICHFYLIKIFDHSPISDKRYPSRTLANYESTEWQAKALCGELMIPFEKFKNKTIREIMNETSSSYSQASYFKSVVCLY